MPFAPVVDQCIPARLRRAPTGIPAYRTADTGAADAVGAVDGLRFHAGFHQGSRRKM
jgi:hypothetical protein